MKFRNWILLLAVVFSQLVSLSFQEEQEYRLENKQEYSDGEGIEPAVFLEPTSTEEIVPLRRVRGRTRINKRRRLRKRIRTTTHAPEEDIVNDQRAPIDDNVAKALEEVYSTLPPIEETTMIRRKMKRRRRPTKVLVDDQKTTIDDNAAKALEEVHSTLSPIEETTTTTTTMRRKTKRRRRPHRKRKQNKKSGQDNKQGIDEEDKGEGSTRKPHRRRRKGGRRKVRPTPQVGTTDENKIELYIETTMIPLEEATTVVNDLGNRALEKLEQEEKNGRIYKVFDSRNNLVSQPTLLDEPFSKVETTPQPATRKPLKYRPYGVKQKVNTIKPEVVEHSKTTMNTIKTDDKFATNKYELDSVNTIKPVKSETANQYQDTELDQLLTNTIKPVSQFDSPLVPVESTNRETNRVPTVVHIRSDFGVKVFDRKALFSKSRKLPETSAIIRKKLNPRLRQNKSEPSTVKPTELVKMSVDSTTIQPQLMESSRLIERLTAHSKSYRTTAPTTSTPSYKVSTTTTSVPVTCRPVETSTNPTQTTSKPTIAPKLTVTTMKPTTEMVFKARFNKVIELHRSRGKSIFTTAKYDFPTTEETTIPPPPATTVNVPMVEIDTTQTPIEETTQTIPWIADNLNLNILNLNKLNDSIAELLKTESGNLLLSAILESRNMTLAQLLDHRERGSSHFVLADIFAEKKSLIGENTTAEEEEPIVDVKPTILFPDEEVMGTFPSFFSDKIQKGDTNKESSHKGYYTTLKAVVRIDNREPRVFDSMPEFSATTVKEEKPIRKMATVPLKPVSIRGKYEEIQIALKPTSKAEETIDNVYVVDDDEELRTNRVASNLGVEPKSDYENNFGAFRKVSVKSAVVISGGIVVLALFGFLSLLISCRLRQKKSRLLRAKRSVMCERLTNEEFMNSQQSLSPVLTKQQRRRSFATCEPVQANPTTHNPRQYYLWRTLRKTFQYD